MTGPEFRRALKALGMRQGAFAERLGVGPITVSRWATGVYPVPRYAEYILMLERLLAAYRRREEAEDALDEVLGAYRG